MTERDTEDESSEEIELGPSTTATKVRNSVLIRERRGNLVKNIFINRKQWEEIGGLFDE